MPELPDVELFRRHLDRTCKGRVIRHVAVNDPKMLAGITREAFTTRLEGACILKSRRHGKHLLVALMPAGWITMHFGLTGALAHWVGAAAEPAYTRIRFDFRDGHHLAYTNLRRLGAVGFAEDAERFIAAERLGPDALDPGLDFAAFERSLSARKRNIKSLLMDQGTIAGIGNIYSDEILFQAGIHPDVPTDRLDVDARKRLFSEVKRVLETAIKRGSGAELLPEALPPTFLLPQRKKGGHCPRCSMELHAAKFSGRTAYYCPHCQLERHDLPFVRAIS